MNYQQIIRLLGNITLIIGVSMTASLPWATPLFGETNHFESSGFWGLVGAMAICVLLGLLLIYMGRSSRGQRLMRREAVAVVGLAWVLATVLGAMPYWLSGTGTCYDQSGKPVAMDVFDGLFESASGFSGTGATILTNLEPSDDLNRETLVPRCVLFWRSETHFLGGLGIMVLFVAILGLGTTGKTLMLTEMPGPAQETDHARSQRVAWNFAIIFISLTLLATIILCFLRVSLFDSLCHAFGTIATGGFSTHNNSVEYFNSPAVETVITIFMVIACVNFALLYSVVILQPGRLFRDPEFRVYLAVMGVASLVVVFSLLLTGIYDSTAQAARHGVFQVVSIMTNTGFGTADFNQWNSLSRAALLLLMFVGGCSGSTSCSIKVIRYILLFKTVGIETEKVFHPSVVRPLRLGKKPVDDPTIGKQIILYFALIMLIFVLGWILLIAVEPDSTWLEAGSQPQDHKLLDCASAVSATLNGVGPGLGIVGESENYSHFHGPGKFILTWLMLLGRLEVFALLALLLPRFWRKV